MADEVAAVAAAATATGTTPTLTPLIEICYGIGGLTSMGVIHKINECVSHNTQIELEMMFTDRFVGTVAMQNTLFRNSRHIKKIFMFNECTDKEEQRRCFNFCTTIVQGITGNGKHLSYVAYRHEFELEQANQLAQALLRSNNNNNGAIDSFHFDERNLTPITFQTLLDAVLATSVRKLVFVNGNGMFGDVNYRDINFDFTGMETNKSLKKLDLSWFNMRKEDFRNLFNSMKVNKGLEHLQLNFPNYQYLSRMKRLFKDMMCENITLLHFRPFYADGEEDEQDGIFQMIRFHMKLNRMWKRYIMKREREKEALAVITRIEEGDNDIEERERKKQLKMRLLFHVFHKKAVLRNTILFHLLREYDLIDTNARIDVTDRVDDCGNDPDDDTNSDNYDDTNNVWSESDDSDSDSDSESNDGGTDDSDDSNVDSDSEIDDGTDGTL